MVGKPFVSIWLCLYKWLVNKKNNDYLRAKNISGSIKKLNLSNKKPFYFLK